MSGAVLDGDGRILWRPPRGAEPAVRRITREIIRSVTGRPVVEGGTGSFRLLAGGDDVPDAVDGDVVWGSGLADPDVAVPRLPAARIIGVRGMLTADRMVAAGVRLRDIPLGDPGVLAARVLGPGEGRDAAPVAVVPSADGRGMAFFRSLASRRDVRIVDLGRDSLESLREIAGAEVVVAQDLHGLIYAEAFGKPSVWIAARSDAGHDFRFRDWYSTMFEKRDRPMLIGGNLDAMVGAARPAFQARPAAELAAALEDAFGRDG